MTNPYEVLDLYSIDTQEQAMQYLKDRLATLEQAYTFYFKGRLENVHLTSPGHNTSRALGGDSVEMAVNERFILGLPMTSKFFTVADFRSADSLILEKRRQRMKPGNVNEGKTILEEEKVISQAIFEQDGKISKEIKALTKVIKDAENMPNDEKAQEAFKDAVIKRKAEDAVVRLAEKTASTLERPATIKPNIDFVSALTASDEYQQIMSSYELLKDSKSRADMDEEHFILSRNEGRKPATLSESEIARLQEQEKRYEDEYLEKSVLGTLHWSAQKREKHQIPGNKKHEYGWAAIITEPKYLLKNEPIENQHFKGKIDVRKLGYFAAESVFANRKIGEAKEKLRLVDHVAPLDISRTGSIKTYNEVVDKLNKGYTLDKAESEFIRMREYAYRYQAQSRSYNSIFEVKLTDSEGRERKQLVISPLKEEDLEDPTRRKFIKEIYFSPYMLDIAEENGGFAGGICKKGPVSYFVSNDYLEDEIKSAVLFSKGTEGRIYDHRGNIEKKEKFYPHATKDTLMGLIGTERERKKDE